MAGGACGTQDLQIQVGEQLRVCLFCDFLPPEPAKLEMAGCYTWVLGATHRFCSAFPLVLMGGLSRLCPLGLPAGCFLSLGLFFYCTIGIITPTWKG